MAAQSQFSLSWGAHKSHLSDGLSSLQQNGELVDMTLAADGHHVKVHQVVLALASPYIKELIASAHNPHPIIFLNKISHGTLSAILEYIYTGEVLVAIEELSELFEAGKELHIKGLEDMNYDLNLSNTVNSLQQQKRTMQTRAPKMKSEEVEGKDYYIEITDGKEHHFYDSTNMTGITETQEEETMMEDDALEQTLETVSEDVNPNETLELPDNNEDPIILKQPQRKTASKDNSELNMMQYTVSNQGSLQLILNRYVYFLKHTRRSGARQWRCVDYLTGSRCPAAVVTNEDLVLQRIKAHTHTFHDKRILKKVKAGAIFRAINEAIIEGANKKTENSQQNANAHNNTSLLSQNELEPLN